jgi:aminoglycoside phosphotransferase family enzyme/predicted kinase
VAIDGTGETIDFAVRMRAFDRTQELDRLLAAGNVEVDELRDLGARLANTHAASPAASAAQTWCDPARMLRALHDAGIELARLWPESRDRLGTLRDWADATWASVSAQQDERRMSGAFRECHGDLHCGNVVRIEGQLNPFDALEFDPALSWIDPVNDLAFLLMDLEARGRSDLAAATLDGWITISGDFAGLSPLRLFLAYRALVRAMVSGIRAAQRPGADMLDDRERYLAAAERHTAAPRPQIIVMAGVSGSGKSWLAERLLAPLDGVRVRSDVERKRLAGLAPLAASGGAIYSAGLTSRTYLRLGEAARAIVAAGRTAIVDAACLKRAERDELRALARRCGVPARIVWVTARDEVLAARIATRSATAADPSEATLKVLRDQQGFVEIPVGAELDGGLMLDSSEGVVVAEVITSLRAPAQ